MTNFCFLNPPSFLADCVDELTLVTLADGSTKTIRDVGSSDLILNLQREQVRLVRGTRGPEAKPMFKIVTKRGHSILATEGHPFLSTESGFVCAKLLAVGSELVMLDGPDLIESISQEIFSGVVFNLYLGKLPLIERYENECTNQIALGKPAYSWRQRLLADLPFAGLSDLEHTMFLNGFVTGDMLIYSAVNM